MQNNNSTALNAVTTAAHDQFAGLLALVLVTFHRSVCPSSGGNGLDSRPPSLLRPALLDPSLRIMSFRPNNCFPGEALAARNAEMALQVPRLLATSWRRTQNLKASLRSQL